MLLQEYAAILALASLLLLKYINVYYDEKQNEYLAIYFFLILLTLPFPLKLLSSLSALEYGGDLIGLLLFGKKHSVMISALLLHDPDSVGKRFLLPTELT